MKNTIKKIREEKNITANELAEKVGISVHSIIAIEKGNFIPSAVNALKIAKILEKKIAELFFLEDDD